MDKKYSISLDISTTNLGIALWNESGKLLELKHLELKIDKSTPAEDRYVFKANLFGRYMVEFKKRVLEKYNAVITNIFVEAPFSNTPKNINTTAMLLAFNGIVCYELYRIFEVIPKKISVHDSRKIFCPEFIVSKKQKGVMKDVLSFPKGWKSKEKKEYIRQKVEDLEPQIEWFYTRNNTIKDSSYDMSDAYCVGYSGLKVLGII